MNQDGRGRCGENVCIMVCGEGRRGCRMCRYLGLSYLGS